MNFIKKIIFNNFSQNQNTKNILKEIFRKAIHICSAFVPFFAGYFYIETVLSLIMITALYIVFEILRLKGWDIPIISIITKVAARQRDAGKFVLGPVTLSLGIVATLIVFPHRSAKIGILALAFGDGLASLVGKFFGKHKLTTLKDKTIAGSMACFFAVFFSTIYVTSSFFMSIVIALVATISEAFPLKDFDNILIPLVCALTSFLMFQQV